MSDSATPHSSLERTRLYLLGLLGTVVLASSIWPQGAFPRESLAVAAGLATCAVGGSILLFMDREKARASLLMPAGILAWCVAWLVAQHRAPVAFLGRPETATMLQGGLMALAAWSLASGIPEKKKACAWQLWYAVAFGVVHALFALYHLHGPASLPRTRANLLEYIASNPGLLPNESALRHALSEGRAVGFIGSPNMLAGLLAPCGVAALGLGVLERGRSRAMGVIAFVVISLALFQTGSRGGFLGAMAGAVVMLAWSLPKMSFGKGSAIAACLAMIALSTGCENSRWFGITTIGQRLAYWQAGGDILAKEGWFLGGGSGAFQVFYPLFRPVGANETVYAHNFIVQWLVDGGAVAVLLFVFLIGLSVLGIVFGRREARTPVVLAGMIAAFLVHGLFDFTMNWHEIALLLFACIGVSSTYIERGGMKIGVSASVALVAAIIACLGLWTTQARPALASLAVEDAEYYASEGDFAEALEGYNRALSWERDNARTLESRGLLRLSLGDGRGVDDLKRALAAHPQSARLHEQVARIAFDHGRRNEAMELQEEAVALHPADPGHRITLLEFALELGDEETARECREFLAQERLLFTDEERARWERFQGLQQED